MKKILLILSLLCPFLVNAQDTADDDFTTMVSQNKIWSTYDAYYNDIDHSSWTVDGESFYFNGFETVNGKTYSRLVYDLMKDTTMALMREEGGKVYVLLDEDFIYNHNLLYWIDWDDRFDFEPIDSELTNTEFVLYDFNLKEGDVFKTIVFGSSLYIVYRRIGKVITANIKGHTVRIQQLLDKNGCETPIGEYDYIVEGYGPADRSSLFFGDCMYMACSVCCDTHIKGISDKTTGESLIEAKDVGLAIEQSGVDEL